MTTESSVTDTVIPSFTKTQEDDPFAEEVKMGVEKYTASGGT
ncbi:hypothetical protein N6P31_21210 [Pectobacterium betavasculorum]|nr:hypothetical protein [Pectobacterium betavasculorum]